MGRLIEAYLAASLPALQAIVAEDEEPKPSLPPGVEGIIQPEGATTFPMGAEPPPMQAQAIGPGGQPIGPMETMAGPGAAAQAQPSFDQTGATPKPAIPPAQGQEQPDRSGEFEAGPDSFAGMSNDADPKDIDNATKAMEEGGVDIDEEYAKVTGSEVKKSVNDPKGTSKGEGLTRQEKALILMEFGLNLMAQSGTGEGTFAGDIGIAGGAAIKGHVGRKAAQAKTLAEAEDKKLERELKRAQITKAQRADVVMSTDAQGNRILVNKQTNKAEPILMDGKPVGADRADKLDFEIKRAAFKAAYGSTIHDAEELERRAVAFANSVREVAFPQLARQDAAKAILKELNEGRNASQKFVVNGVEKRWKNMSYAEKTKTARQLVDMAMEAAREDVQSSDGAGANFGLNDKQVKDMEPNTKYKLSNDKWVAKRNGKLVEVDPPGK